MTDTPKTDDLIDVLRDLSPEALPSWSRIVASMVEHKVDLGIAASDEEVVAAAAGLFTLLLQVCVDARRRGDALGEHRLAALEWFTSACGAELFDAAERPTVN